MKIFNAMLSKLVLLCDTHNAQYYNSKKISKFNRPINIHKFNYHVSRSKLQNENQKIE